MRLRSISGSGEFLTDEFADLVEDLGGSFLGFHRLNNLAASEAMNVLVVVSLKDRLESVDFDLDLIFSHGCLLCFHISNILRFLVVWKAYCASLSGGTTGSMSQGSTLDLDAALTIILSVSASSWVGTMM